MSDTRLIIKPEDREEAFSVLPQAAKDVLGRTRYDIQEIEQTSWYRRLWKVITFSKDNEIRLASCVSNLDKLQEIVVRCLLILSYSQKEAQQLVTQNAKRIHDVAENVEGLQNAVIAYTQRGESGVKYEATLDSLSDVERGFFSGVVMHLAEDLPTTPESQKYMAMLLNTLNILGQDTDQIQLDYIEELDKEKRYLLCRILLEYTYLSTNRYELPEEISDCFTSRMIREVKENVDRMIRLCGRENLTRVYRGFPDDVDMLDDSGIDYDALEIDGSSGPGREIKAGNTEDCEDLIFESEKDQAQHGHFTNQRVILTSDWHCDGDTVFENCVFEWDMELSGICSIVSDGYNLAFIHCTFRGLKFPGQAYFVISRVNSEDASGISFKECLIDDCRQLVCTDKAKVSFELCDILNSKEVLMSEGMEELTISDCTVQDSESVFALKNSQDIKITIQSCALCHSSKILEAGCIAESLISDCTVQDSQQVLVSDKIVGLSFSDCTVQDSQEVLHSDIIEKYDISGCTVQDSVKIFCFGNGGSGESRFHDCEFQNDRNCLIVTNMNGVMNVEKCSFDSCVYPIKISVSLKMEDCRFDHCFAPICGYFRGVSMVQKCEFKHCYGLIEQTGGVGTMSISNCRFDDIQDYESSENYKNDESQEMAQKGSISLYLTSSGNSTILNCRFSQTHLTHDALIVCEKLKSFAADVRFPSFLYRSDGEKAVISKCIFNECSTDAHEGKLICDIGNANFSHVVIDSCMGLDDSCQ